MNDFGYIASEFAVAALLAGLLLLALLFQPTWIWVVATLVMIGAFVGIILWVKIAPARARLLVFLSPLTYVVYLMAIGLSAPAPALFATTAAYYAGGVILLLFHHFLNAKAQSKRSD